MTSDVTYQCAICDETVEDGRLVAECMACTRTFHLNPYSKGEHKDCGDAIIGPTEGVEFWCQDCLAELDADANANQPDPRAFLDDVAAPAALFPRGRDEVARPDASPAHAPAPAATRSASTPPPRRGRTQPRKRYRRVDR